MNNNELDYKIAKNIMGWKERVDFYIEDKSILIDVHFGYSIFSPTVSMKDAWMVVLKIRELDEHWCPNIYWDDADGLGNPYWVAAFQYFGGEKDEFIEHVEISETSAPLAICLAALKVIGENDVI